MRTEIGYIRVSSEEQADSGLGLETLDQAIQLAESEDVIFQKVRV